MSLATGACYLQMPELRNVLGAHIARCIFVQHALSRTCRAFRARFTNAKFLAIQQMLHGQTMERTDQNDQLSCLLVPFDELFEQLKTKTGVYDSHPHFHRRVNLSVKTYEGQDTFPMTWRPLSIVNGMREFSFYMGNCPEKFIVSKNIYRHEIANRTCRLFGCNCVAENHPFEMPLYTWMNDGAMEMTTRRFTYQFTI